MVEFKWIKPFLFLFLMLVLQFQVITGQESYLTVRDGDEVTLPCKNALKKQKKCNSTTWLFVNSRQSRVVELITLGQIGEKAQAKHSVKADCSLVIKKVAVNEAGQYSCRQYNELRQYQGPDALVYLSVINIYEHRVGDKVTLSCSVLTYDRCTHTVKWLYEGNKDSVTIQGSSCAAHVTFKTSPPHEKLPKCNVTDRNSHNFLLCDLTPQSSCEKIDPDGNTNREGDLTSTGDYGSPAKQDPTPHWWVYIIVAVGLAAILITVGVLIRQRKTKGNKTQRNDSTGLSLNPTATQSVPRTSQDMDDPEDAVPYASISYTKKTNRTAQVQEKAAADDDDGDESAVTYSSVNVSPGDSTDPSSLYATVNKSKKKQDVTG